jgi:hypothetical protein
MQRLPVFPATPDFVLLDRTKSKPLSWPHTTSREQLCIRWCCIDLLRAPGLPDISNNVGPVKHFLSTLLHRLKRVFSLPSFVVSLIGPGQVRFVRNLAVGSVRPNHLFDLNFDHDWFFELPLTRERDALSSGRRFTPRHVRYRAVPRTNRTLAPSSRSLSTKP